MALWQIKKKREEFRKELPSIRQSVREVNALMRRIDPTVVRTAWANAAYEGLSLIGASAVMGILMQKVVGTYTRFGTLSWKTVGGGIALLGGYTIGKNLVSGYLEWRGSGFSEKLDYQLELEEVNKLLSLDLGRLNDPEFVALKEAAERRGNNAVQALFRTQNHLISAAIGAFVAMGIILALDPFLIVLAFLPVIPRTFKAVVIEAKQRKLWEDNHVLRRKKNEYNWCLTSKTRLITTKLMRWEKHYFARYDHYAVELREAELALKWLEFKMDVALYFIEACVAVGAMIYVGNGIITGAVTIAKLFLFLGSMRTFANALSTLSSTSVRLTNLSRDYGYRTRFFATKPFIDESGASQYAFNSLPELSLKEVSFSYPGQEGRLALKDCSFKVKPGEKVAIVGRNGSGKTTALRLLTKVYLPKTGQVFLDMMPTGHILQKSLLKHVLYVTQGGDLPDFRLDEAICGSLPEEVDLSRLREACSMAGAAEIIAPLSDGFAAQIGEDWPGGVGFSTGQLQRLKLAAAFYRLLDPSVYIGLFDEPMANCDVQTRERFYEMLGRISNKTIIVIAHDPLYLHHFERVIVMEEGRVVEDLQGEQAIEGYRASIARSLLTDL